MEEFKVKTRYIRNGFRADMEMEKIYDHQEAGNIFDIIHEDVFNSIPEFSEADVDRLSEIIERLKKHEPIQYILGEADFYSLKFKVTPDVLIPRPETEELVNAVIQEIRKSGNQKSEILDIGTGSGCIPITLKKNLPDVQVTSIDVSQKALLVAEENAERNETEIYFIRHDFLEEQLWNEFGSYDIIVSNPPYITKTEFNALDKKVKEFEPQTALIAPRTDPFIFYRKIAVFAQTHLNSNGRIFLELNAAHADEISQIFSQAGFNTAVLKDLQGKNRMLKAFVN
jgi:release factor glutamine methyltransferase